MHCYRVTAADDRHSRPNHNGLEQLSYIEVTLRQVGAESSIEADLVVTKPLNAAKGGAAPHSHPPGVYCGDIAALRGPLYKAFCPEAAFVDLQQSRGPQAEGLAMQQKASD